MFLFYFLPVIKINSNSLLRSVDFLKMFYVLSVIFHPLNGGVWLGLVMFLLFIVNRFNLEFLVMKGIIF